MSRKLIVAAVVAWSLLVLAAPLFAQAPDPGRIERSPPSPVVKYLDPRGNEVITIDNDGTLNFDFGGTVAWSRYFVGAWVPPACRDVWVLTWVNGPGGRRALFLRGCEAIPASDKP